MTPRKRPGRRPARDALFSRRAALGLGVATTVGIASAGCALNNPLDEERTPAAKAVRDLAPDVGVAVRAATAIGAAGAAVEATTARHPALGDELAGLLATHRTHLDAVADAVPEGVDTSPGSGGSAYVVPGRPARALVRLVTTEKSLHDTLVGLALRAESGALARLLGSMAAAVSQQLHGLPS